MIRRMMAACAGLLLAFLLVGCNGGSSDGSTITRGNDSGLSSAEGPAKVTGVVCSRAKIIKGEASQFRLDKQQ